MLATLSFLLVNIVKLVEDVSMITIAVTKAAPIEYKDRRPNRSVNGPVIRHVAIPPTDIGAPNNFRLGLVG